MLKGVAGPGLLKEVVGVAASPAALLDDSRCLPGRFGRPAGGQGEEGQRTRRGVAVTARAVDAPGTTHFQSRRAVMLQLDMTQHPQYPQKHNSTYKTRKTRLPATSSPMSPCWLASGERAGVLGWLRLWCPGSMPAAAAAVRSAPGAGMVMARCTAGSSKARAAANLI